MRLATDRLRIIPFEPQFGAHIYRWFHSGDYEFFFGNCPMLTLGDVVKFAGHAFMIVSPDAKQVYGMFLVSRIEERHRNCHIGVLIDKVYQGKGIGPESTKLMLYYIMNAMNFYKAIATINSEHHEAIKAAIALGFEKEGEFKDEIYFDGTFHDLSRYRILKGPFNRLHKAAVEEMSEKARAVVGA